MKDKEHTGKEQFKKFYEQFSKNLKLGIHEDGWRWEEGEGQEEEEDKREVRWEVGAEQDEAHLGAEPERDQNARVRRVLQVFRRLLNSELTKIIDVLISLTEYISRMKEKQKDINRIRIIERQKYWAEIRDNTLREWKKSPRGTISI